MKKMGRKMGRLVDTLDPMRPRISEFVAVSRDDTRRCMRPCDARGWGRAMQSAVKDGVRCWQDRDIDDGV
jgi:hypothetical protein